jgi:transcription initiation factor IIF auxiliary subunit
MASHANKTLRNPCLDITSPPISVKRTGWRPEFLI